MLETYTLMYKDIEVGTITYDQELDKFEFELNENIKEHEFELLKMILAKYIRDEKYRSQKIQKSFLFFIKFLLKCHQKIKALVLNENFISFLFEQKNNFYEQKLSFEIIISS